MKVLVVDDSRAMRMIVLRTLRQAGFDNHEYVEAANGQEGLERIRSENPDVVLSDMNMPEMNGLELLKNCKAEYPDLRFGFITSESNDETRQQATDEGAEFFITKPFSPESFESVLSPVLC